MSAIGLQMRFATILAIAVAITQTRRTGIAPQTIQFPALKGILQQVNLTCDRPDDSAPKSAFLPELTNGMTLLKCPVAFGRFTAPNANRTARFY